MNDAIITEKLYLAEYMGVCRNVEVSRKKLKSTRNRLGKLDEDDDDAVYHTKRS